MRFAIGPEPRWRLSINVFADPAPERERWKPEGRLARVLFAIAFGHDRERPVGFHVKLRRGTVFRHFHVKAQGATSAFGKRGQGRELWIGWFESRAGVRGLLNGWRIRVQIDRMRDYKPTPNSVVPIYPTQSRDRRLPFQPGTPPKEESA